MSFISQQGVITPPLTAGGVAYGNGSNAFMTGAGTAGQVLTSAGAGAPVWGAGGGLNLISSQTISTAVASVDFTSGINSTYDNYYVVFSNFKVQAGGRLRLRLRQGTSFVTANYATFAITAANGGSISSSGSTTDTFLMSTSGTPDTSSTFSGYFNLQSVNNATRRSQAANGYVGMLCDSGLTMSSGIFTGTVDVAGAITGFQFLSAVGNLTAGTIALYGLAK